MNKSLLSIQRAMALLDISCGQENFLIIKLEPEPRSCCCFHCWPETWSAVNRHIVPFGPIKDEGDVVIKHEDHEFILECHESGPEIIVYLGLATASLVLVKSVVDLITTFLKTLQKENRRAPAKIKVMTRRFIKGSDKDEILIELDFPLSKDIADKLNSKIREALQKHTEQAVPPDRR